MKERLDEIEILRMQLAGCGVAAMCNTEESIKQQRISKDSPYYCASYQDVCDAVDREMKYRALLLEAMEALENIKSQMHPAGLMYENTFISENKAYKPACDTLTSINEKLESL